MPEQNITVGFDTQRKHFSFDGLTLTSTGLQLGLPYRPSEDAYTITFTPQPGSDWAFLAVNIIGSHTAIPGYQCAWRTVRRDEGPVQLVNNSRITLEVLNVSREEITLLSVNRSPTESVAFRIEVTVELEDGSAWTSPDPQVVNEKEDT